MIVVRNTINVTRSILGRGSLLFRLEWYQGCPRGVMVKAMDCEIVASVLQSRYYVHFRTNTLGKVMNPLILPAMG